jgi:hypothetical protein
MSDNRYYVLHTDSVSWVLEDRNTGRTDYPMWVQRPANNQAHVLYNYPELIPEYVKRKVYQKLKAFYEAHPEEVYTPSPENDTP